MCNFSNFYGSCCSNDDLLKFAACTITCSIQCLWKNMLSPSLGRMNLVQVDAVVIGKGTK